MEDSAKQDIVLTVHALSASCGGQQISCTSLGGDVVFETLLLLDSKGLHFQNSKKKSRTLGDLRSVLACLINKSDNAQRVALDGVAYTFGEFEEWYGAQHAHRM